MKSFSFYLNASNFFINALDYDDLSSDEKEYNCLAAVLLSWISLEAYVNSISISLSKGKRLDINELAFLNELEYRIDSEGKIIKNQIRPSTSKKLLFLLQNFSKKDVKKFKQTALWRNIQNFEDLRNKILHFKEQHEVKVSLKKAIECRDITKDCIEYFNKTLR